MMFQKKDCIAMLLAGGQGSRLMVLTENTAKPAVPFGGKYRIIDFPLSNCVNSGIDTVGILTQYQPLELNEYIGNGQPWGLSSSYGGIHVLPPYARSNKSEWYKGTANAIYQNMAFIDRYQPDDVLILSGDHIYTMDYAEMMAYHKKTGADCTIAVIDVPMEEASRFGIMDAAEDGRIRGFEEKPAHPKSTKASMGIYLFKWKVLKEYLIADENDPASENDFGKNIIPTLLGDGHPMYAFAFRGYWKDVGTISSLWEANMDILGEHPSLALSDPKHRIYARNYAMPSSYIAPETHIENAFVAEGCEVYGQVEGSILSTGCVVEPGAVIRESFVMPNAHIGRDARIEYAIIGEGADIGEAATVGGGRDEETGARPGIAVIGKDKKIDPGAVVGPGEII